MEELIEVSKSIFYPRRVVDRIRDLVGSRIRKIFSLSKIPFGKYYLRVNTLKASREEVVEMLREEGVRVEKDNKLEEAIYIEVKKN